jgi:hypothetical protein
MGIVFDPSSRYNSIDSDVTTISENRDVVDVFTVILSVKSLVVEVT